MKYVKKLFLGLFTLLMIVLLVAGSSENPVMNSKVLAQESISGSSVNQNYNFIQDVDVVLDKSRPSTANSDQRYAKITSAIAAELAELQPYKDRAGKILASREIYEPLFDIYGANNYKGRLAKSLNIIDDTHYEVKIFDYIHDTGGNNITASDVVFSYNLFLDSGYVEDAEYIESIEAKDNYTVLFTFTKPLGESLSAFYNILGKVYIVSEKAYNTHNFSTDPVGTGPYMVTDFIPGSHITLEVNEDYWQKEELRNNYVQQNVQTIQINQVGDPALAELAVVNGENAIHRLDSSSVKKFMEGGKYEGKANLYLHTYPINFSVMPNCSENSICNDINMRLAIFYAIDNQVLAEATGNLTHNPGIVDVSDAAPDYSTDWEDYAIDTYQTVYDPEIAKGYLAKTDYDGEKLTILCGSDRTMVTCAQVIQGSLQAIGINCTIATYDMTILDNYISDSSGWDILVNNEAALPYSIDKLMAHFSAAYNNGTSVNFINDDKLQNMLNECYSVDGYSQENVGKILKYIIDNAYSCGILNSKGIYAYDTHIAQFCRNFAKELILGGCEYYLD